MSEGTGRFAYTEPRERVEASEALIAQLFDEIRRLRAQMERIPTGSSCDLLLLLLLLGECYPITLGKVQYRQRYYRVLY